MSDEINGKSPYDIRKIIGQYTVLSTPQREILYAVFEVRDNMDEDTCKDVFRKLIDAKLIPHGTADSIRKRIYES